MQARALGKARDVRRAGHGDRHDHGLRAPRRRAGRGRCAGAACARGCACPPGRSRCSCRRAARSIARSSAPASPVPRTIGIWPMPSSTLLRPLTFHSEDFDSARIWRRLIAAMPITTGSQYESWLPTIEQRALGGDVLEPLDVEPAPEAHDRHADAERGAVGAGHRLAVAHRGDSRSPRAVGCGSGAVRPPGFRFPGRRVPNSAWKSFSSSSSSPSSPPPRSCTCAPATRRPGPVRPRAGARPARKPRRRARLPPRPDGRGRRAPCPGDRSARGRRRPSCTCRRRPTASRPTCTPGRRRRSSPRPAAAASPAARRPPTPTARPRRTTRPGRPVYPEGAPAYQEGVPAYQNGVYDDQGRAGRSTRTGDRSRWTTEPVYENGQPAAYETGPPRVHEDGTPIDGPRAYYDEQGRPVYPEDRPRY